MREAALSKPRHSVAEIYDRFTQLMEIPKNKRGRATERVCAEFGISAAGWQRLRTVYREHLLGVGFATTLVKWLDDGTVTPTEAERLLKQHQDDNDLTVQATSVKLPEAVRQLVPVNAYFDVVCAALRQGLRVDVGKMSEDDVASAIDMVRSVGQKMLQTADLLHRAALSGGTTAHD